MRRLLDDRIGRLLLTAAFVAVHSVLVAQVWLAPLAPFNDVIGVYREWVVQGLESGDWVGLSLPFVYPPLALVPMLAAAAFGTGVAAYGWTWLGLVVLLDAAAVVVLVGRGRLAARRRGMVAAWWWLAFLLLLGPVGIARLEAITAPIAIIAVRLLLERPAVAGALLALGAWIKIWPGALLAVGAVALRSRLRLVLGAVVATAAVLGLGLGLGGREQLLGFLAGQTDRGLQVESLLAAPWLVGAALGVPEASVQWRPGLLTFEVDGPGAAAVSAWSTPLLLVAAAVVLGLVLLARRQDERAALVLGAIALVTVLVVTNKVGSPQFTAWLAAPLVLAILLARRRAAGGRSRVFLPAILALGIAALTQIVYPTGYDLLLHAQPALVAILLLKHALWLGLAGWSIGSLARLARR